MTAQSLTAEIDSLRAAFDEVNTERRLTHADHSIQSAFRDTWFQYHALTEPEEAAAVWIAEKISRLCRFRSLLLAKDYCVT